MRERVIDLAKIVVDLGQRELRMHGRNLIHFDVHEPSSAANIFIDLHMPPRYR